MRQLILPSHSDSDVCTQNRLPTKCEQLVQRLEGHANKEI